MSTVDADLESALETLRDNLRLAIDDLALIRKISPRKLNGPWIDRGCIFEGETG